MARSRASLALMAGDALSDLIASESQGLVGDPAKARSAKSRTARAKHSGTRASLGSSGKLLKRRARSLVSSRAGGLQRPSSRRRRGISAAQLRGFRRVVRLLHSIGMQPKRLRVKKPRT